MTHEYELSSEDELANIPPDLLKDGARVRIGKDLYIWKSYADRVEDGEANPYPDDILLHCPFCPDGGDPHIQTYDHPKYKGGPLWWVGCDTCGCTMPAPGHPGKTAHDAVAAWNTRYVPESEAE